MGLFSWLFNLTLEVPGQTGTSPSTSRVKRPVMLNGRVCQRIERNTTRYHDHRGWKAHGKILKGYYRTTTEAFEGAIENFAAQSPRFYIINPPEALLTGPHGACFSEKGDGIYSVHFRERPKNIDVGIQAIELCLKEALGSCGTSQTHSVNVEKILKDREIRKELIWIPPTPRFYVENIFKDIRKK